jgi:hypothetical protein
MSNLFKSVKEAEKSFAFKYTTLGAPTYRYNIEPIQLATLINEIERLKDIKVAFLDVDLYVPTKKTLVKVYDSAYQAYMEFCEERQITPQVIGNKFGLIFKKSA